MSEIIEELLEKYIPLTIAIQTVTFIFMSDNRDLSLRPSWFYKNTNMNRFGCWFVSFILSFIFYFFAIGEFLYWICHIGREE